MNLVIDILQTIGLRSSEVRHLRSGPLNSIILTLRGQGSAWTFDHGSGEYYLHLFRREQPDLNWENPEVIYEVHQIIEFWLQKGVDGFRMDVINLISKTPGLPNAPINDASQQFQPAHMHYAYGPRLHEHLRGLRTILDRYDAFAVGEMPWVNQEDQVLETVADHKKELNLIFQFDMYVHFPTFRFSATCRCVFRLLMLLG